MKKVLLTFTLLMSCAFASWGHDFAVANADGDTIYYYIHSDFSSRTVGVTYKGQRYDSYHNEYSGNLNIPTSVSYGGSTYSVTSIGSETFENCSNITSVTIPNSITSIGWSAFKNCSSLNSFTIPNSVTSIEQSAFYGCNSLVSVTIPTSVTSIGWCAFYQVGNILYQGSATGSPWGALHLNGFADGDLIFSDSTRTHLIRCLASADSVTIPSSITYIGSLTFCNCSSLVSVTIPSSVTSIGSQSFSGCSSLTSITIPNSVTSIGYSAFLGCSSLTSVAIPNSVTSMSECVFYDCSSLASVTIPNSITDIDISIFSACSSLTSVTIPSSVTYIHQYAFKNCSSLTSVTIPSSVTYIGWRAFDSCTSLTSVTIPTLLDRMDGLVFQNCSSLTSVYWEARDITSYEQYYRSDYNSFPCHPFSGCTSLSHVTFDNRVITIPDSAFYGCSSITSVTIGSRITSIGASAFDGCSAIDTMRIDAVAPPHMSNWTFRHVSDSVPVYVPCGTVSDYLADEEWSRFVNIFENGSCQTTVTATANNNARGTVTGGGDYASGDTCTLTATADEGFLFLSWNDNGTINPQSFTVAQDTQLMAIFVPTHLITDTLIHHDTTIVNNYIHDTTIVDNYIHDTTIVVQYDTTFVDNFIHDTTIVNNYIHDTVTQAATYYSLSVMSGNDSQGQGYGTGSYPEDCIVTIVALPYEGYRFTGWNDGNTENPRQITVSGAASYVANFAPTSEVDSPEVKALEVFPNPTRDIIQLSSPEVQQVEIYDGLGHKVGS